MDQKDYIIEADELLKRIGDESLRVFDASVNDAVYRQEHLPGAAYFDHEKVSDSTSPYACTLSPEDLLVKQIGDRGISNDSEVILYACGMLPYAVRAWWVLRYAGHQKVRVLNGGLAAWKSASGSTEQTPNQYEPSVFSGNFDHSMFAAKEEVLASKEDQDVAIVDVLPLVSYEGAHIPGSICLPCLDLMNGMDYFRPLDQMAARLGEVSQRKRIITYCGGGIAAAVNAMAHMMAGHTNVAVYDGSLYEWLGEGLPVIGTGEWEIWRL